MKMPVRIKKLTMEECLESQDETLLLGMAMNHFYKAYLPALRDEIVSMLWRQDVRIQMRRFWLDAYFEARVWLEDHKSLAATLELRKPWPPGWLKRF